MRGYHDERNHTVSIQIRSQKYAHWLAEETGFDCVETNKAKTSQLQQYDTVILGGGIYASGILGLPFLKRNMNQLKGKKVAVFCVGASPYTEEAFQQIYSHNFKGELSGIRCFYCRGPDLSAMSFRQDTMHNAAEGCVQRSLPPTSLGSCPMEAFGQR